MDFGLFDLNFLAQLPFAGDQCETCPASAFNPVTAAFSTLGYYAQAEWLHQIVNGGLGSWAALAYILSSIGFLVSVAIGLPMRNYLWFAMGPALFWWLVDTRVAVDGVAWRVGPAGTIADRPQSKVWELAETGLLNDTYIIRNNFDVSASSAPTGGNTDCDGYGAACVSQIFLILDTVISDTVAQLSNMLGVSRARPGNSAIDSNIAGGGLIPLPGAGGGSSQGVKMWDLTTNLKWEFIYSITTARIVDNNVRTYFASFMSSECGKTFIESIDMTKMTAATYARGRIDTGDALSASVLKSEFGPPSLVGNPIESGSCPITIAPPTFGAMNVADPLWISLYAVEVPVNNGFRKIFDQGVGDGSIAKQSGLVDWYGTIPLPPGGFGPPVPTTSPQNFSQISCAEYLYTLIQLLRWEAALTTYQLLRAAPVGMLPADYAAQMLYGWSIKDGSLNQISRDTAPRFLENLVLVHLFRNELQIAPSQIVQQRVTAAQRTVKSTEDFQRINGQAAKYGELYTWALMMPYFQGKLLYFLAIAYPFAAMLIVVPGMHSVILTWMQFWIWVKLWDLGFAIVTVLERSVWAMTSNSMSGSGINSLVYFVSQLNPTCYEPSPTDTAMSTTFIPTDVEIPRLTMNAAANLIDKLLFLSSNIQLDMANTYYVYIMSALYFAIPAVTGQLVLGAKSGAAGMVSSAIGQISSPAGSAAGQSAAADIGAKMKMNQAVGRQEAYASSLRSSGLAKGALHASNTQTQSHIDSDAAGTKSQMYGNFKEGLGQEISMRNSLGGLQGKAAGLYGGAAGGAIGVGLAKTDIGKFFGLDGTGGGAGGAGVFGGAGAIVAGMQADLYRHNDIGAMTGKSMGETLKQIDEGEAGFSARAAASVNGLEAGRAESHASFVAEQAAWDSANNYAQANSEFAASIGLGAGYLDAGQKPTNLQGMAREGLLGAEAQSLSTKSQNVDNFAGEHKKAIKGAADRARQANNPGNLDVYMNQNNAITPGSVQNGKANPGMPEFIKDTAALGGSLIANIGPRQAVEGATAVVKSAPKILENLPKYREFGPKY